MVYPNHVLKLSVGGSVAGEDVWTNSFHLASAVDSETIAAFNGLNPQQFASAFQAFYIGSGAGMAPFNRLGWIKTALIAPDGKYAEGTESKVYDFPTSPAGTGNFSVSPQDSIVISLTTDVKRGLANRGRFYPPAGFGQPLNATGKISTTITDSIAARAKTLIDGINTVGSSQPAFNVVAIVASNVREGAFNIIQGIEVGNLMDNQKRRRNKLSEVYSSIEL